MAARTNYITNPNFETSIANWIMVNNSTMTSTQSTDYALTGSYSMKLVQTTAGVDSEARQLFTGLPTGSCIFSASYYISSYTSGAANNRLLLIASGTLGVPTNIIELIMPHRR